MSIDSGRQAVGQVQDYAQAGIGVNDAAGQPYRNCGSAILSDEGKLVVIAALI